MRLGTIDGQATKREMRTFMKQHYLAVITLTRETSLYSSDINGAGMPPEAMNRLAERGLAEFFGYKEASGLKSRWLGGDLFLSALFSFDGETQPEMELSAQIADAMGRWEAFAGLEEQKAPRWKAGAGWVLCPGGKYNRDLTYEAAKRAMHQVQIDGGLEQGRRFRVFRQMLAERSLFPHYQPIIDMGRGGVFGFEALTRFPPNNSFQGPYDLFRFADEVGDVYRLDRLARELAINGCMSLGPDQKLFINVMAQIMEDPDFSPGRTISLLEKHHISPSQVVFEMNERSAIRDYSVIKKALRHYRSQGYQIAIDDMGAGYSSLQSVVELRPDYLKIDRSIIQNIHRDEVKAHIVSTLQEIGSKIGAALIAEGIELEEELAELKAMGIPYAQGYLTGRPAPFPLS